LPVGSLACCAVVNPILNVRISTYLAWLPIEYHDKPLEIALCMLPGRLGSLTAFALESYHSIVEERRIADKAIGFGRRFEADVLWASQVCFACLACAHTRGRVDVHNLDTVTKVLTEMQVPLVLNWIGLVKQCDEANTPHSIDPDQPPFRHQVADFCDERWGDFPDGH